MSEPFRITEPGFYPAIAPADYFADPCPAPSFTQSLAKILIERSPLHAKLAHPRLCPSPAEGEGEGEKYDAAKAIGNAAHALMIGRSRDIAVGQWDSWRTKDSQAFRDQVEKRGGLPILAKHHERAREMVMAARTQLLACGCEAAFREGDGAGEVMIAWREGDLWSRSLIDWLPSDRLMPWDYKTSGLSCNPYSVSKLMIDGGWDIQAAMHERGLDVLDPDNAGRRRFRYVAQENEPPYALTVCELSEAVLTMGRKKLAYAVQLWSACMRADTWPSYPAEIYHPEYPGWAETKWLTREVEHEARALPKRGTFDPRNVLAG